MENLAHTLFGLALAEAGLENVTPLATATLVVSSNLPDIDFLMSLRGGSLSYIKYHRGYTHSLVGILVLAALLTFVLVFLDSRMRLRRDPFRRPIRPGRIFWLGCVGGLGHLLLDLTNSYGVRPLIPFSNHWFYGDLFFVVDPWIWLILGAAVVWVTLRSAARGNYYLPALVFWLLVATGTGLTVALALKGSNGFNAPVPDSIRIVWFAGLAVIAIGAILKLGENRKRFARWSMIALCAYTIGMWMARQSAAQDAVANTPQAAGARLAVWPQPANPSLWAAVFASDGNILSRDVSLAPGFLDPTPQEPWKKADALDQKFRDALQNTDAGRTFLSFARFPSATVEETPDGYKVTVSDARFSLKLHAELDRDMNVQSSRVTWF